MNDSFEMLNIKISKKDRYYTHTFNRLFIECPYCHKLTNRIRHFIECEKVKETRKIIEDEEKEFIKKGFRLSEYDGSPFKKSIKPSPWQRFWNWIERRLKK